MPKGVKARLYLIEGLTDDTNRQYNFKLGVPQQFFDFHESNTIRCVDATVDQGACRFFAKWSRPENRIKKGTPYSLDTVRDPLELRLDHERYKRYPGIHRVYTPISETVADGIHHAATECISCYWKHNNEDSLVYKSCEGF